MREDLGLYQGAEDADQIITSLSPDEIRAIRRRRKLSQVRASLLLGGGRRAFSKYETGAGAAPASIVALLRLAQKRPEMLADLTRHLC